MRALVTGCAGFIASHLTESLLEDGCDVLGVDCFNNNYGRARKLRNLEAARGWDSFEFVPIDLARGDLRELVDDCEVVYHLAAEPGVRASWGTRFASYVANNLTATQHLLEALRGGPERSLVYASSSSVYGQAEAFPTAETAMPRPRSPYGTTKLMAEHLCLAYHLNYGLPVISLRLFSVYGPRQRPDMAFEIFCRAALAGEPIPVYGEGNQTRDFTYVGDVVAALRAAADIPQAYGRVYNIGGGSQVSLRAAIATIGDLAGREIPIENAGPQPGDVQDTAADISAARRDLGFRPQVNLAEGLGMQMNWVRQELAVGSARG